MLTWTRPLFHICLSSSMDLTFDTWVPSDRCTPGYKVETIHVTYANLTLYIKYSINSFQEKFLGGGSTPPENIIGAPCTAPLPPSIATKHETTTFLRFILTRAIYADHYSFVDDAPRGLSSRTICTGGV